jgi:predicted AAA+ superfamily ATPase
MYKRKFELLDIIKKRSIFLLGPRRTGKSTLLKSLPAEACQVWDLLDGGVYQDLLLDPTLIRKKNLNLKVKPDFIVIDEIQKLPLLLDEVHLMIETYGWRFILSGSSARSLKRKGVNLLAGRAHMHCFHPFVASELGEDFNLLQALNYGGLPSIYLSDEPQEELHQYAGVYLAEEIAFEGLVRQLPSFARFLEMAALCNGQHINFTTFASDLGLKRTTVLDWFQILRDTLMIFEVPVWQQSQKRKAIQMSKFYFFDVGLVRSLKRAAKLESLTSPEVGAAFEHWVFHELQTSCDYKIHKSLHTWRSTSQLEVDFILDEEWAIEVKAKSRISSHDCKGLLALKEENLCKRYTIVCFVPSAYTLENGIEVLPFELWVKELWKV